MTKVTRKIFAVLEFIARQGGRGVLPSELVDALKLNQTTCIRILKDLVELGYLEQISRQRGYALGPLANWLANVCAYEKDFVEAARPLVEDCARKAGQSVLLAIRRFDKRYVLAHCNCNPRMHVDVSAPYWKDFYFTATGRLLLAYAPDEELRSVIKSIGLPDDGDWPEAMTMDCLKKALSSIRSAGFVSYSRGNDLFISAFPVWRDGVFGGALGMSVPCRELPSEEAKGSYAALLKECAAALSSKVSAVRSAG